MHAVRCSLEREYSSWERANFVNDLVVDMLFSEATLGEGEGGGDAVAGGEAIRKWHDR